MKLEDGRSGGAGGPRLPRRVQLLLVAIVWATIARLPGVVSSVDLDPSWQHAYAHFLATGMQAGVDYVFTYGPLGFVEYGAYHPELFWGRMLLWDGVAKLAMSIAFVAALARMRGWVERAAFLGLFLLAPVSFEPLFLLAILVLCVLLASSDGPPWRWLVVAAALLAALGLIKFVQLSFVAASVALLVAGRALEGRPRQALRVGAAVALAYLAGWLLTGQQLAHLPVYLLRSLEIASGYNSGMSIQPAEDRLLLALAMTAAASLAALLFVLGRPFHWRRPTVAAVFLLGAFVAFKAAFVRHGGSDTFFLFSGAGVFLLLEPRGAGAEAPAAGAWMLARRLGLRALQVACAAIAFVSLPDVERSGAAAFPLMAAAKWKAVVQEVPRFARLPQEERELQEERAQDAERYTLPAFAELIGDGTVDVIPDRQALALYNGMRWHPRPVFQSYSAYTVPLQDLNARHYTCADAPRYVIFHPGEALDGRLPAGEDAAVMQILCREYELQHGLDEYLLLARKLEGGSLPPPPRDVLLERELGLGETVRLDELAGEALVLELDIRPSAWGKLVSVLYQAPAVLLQVEVQDRAQEPYMVAYRILPEVMGGGVLLSPLLVDASDWLRWWTGDEPRRVVSIGVRTENGWRSDELAPRVGLRILRADDLVPPPIPALRRRLASRWLPASLVEARAARPLAIVNVGIGMAVHVGAPSVLRFDPGAGTRAVRAGFGILDDAVEDTDGVGFSLAVVAPGGREQVVWSRFLDPRRRPEDRGPQLLLETLEVPEGGHVELRTDPGPSGDAAFDHAWLMAVRIEEPAGQHWLQDAKR